MNPQRRDSDFIHAVGKRLKELRNEKGLSQETVYFHTNIHIGRVETGKYNITISTLKQLCDYYGVSVIGFFKGITL